MPIHRRLVIDRHRIRSRPSNTLPKFNTIDVLHRIAGLCRERGRSGSSAIEIVVIRYRLIHPMPKFQVETFPEIIPAAELTRHL